MRPITLAECAQKHTGPTEDALAAYAKIRVHCEMLEQIRRLLNNGRGARKKCAAYEEALDKLRGDLGRDPSRAEIARAKGLSGAKLLEIEASAITLISIADEYDKTNTAFAAEGSDPFEVLSEMENRDRLITAMRELPERLDLFLQLFDVEELNLTEIAEVLQVSVPRVYQLRAKALGNLKKRMEAGAA